MRFNENVRGVAFGITAAALSVLALPLLLPVTASPQAVGTTGGTGGRAGRGSAYPTRPPADPTVVARGKQLFGVNCSFCHGSDARGGEGGPNLIRSQLVLDDMNGELIAPVVQNGRADRGMPKFELTAENVSDIAAFLHGFYVIGHDPSRDLPVNILVGDAKAGEAYFNGAGKCNTCHSVTGDLAGIGSKDDPKALQNALVSGGKGRGAAAASKIPPTIVKVTLPSGETVQGKLERIDDFDVSLTDASGLRRTFRRSDDVPKVEVTNPLQAHWSMLKMFTDDEIHNLTAYLVTLK